MTAFRSTLAHLVTIGHLRPYESNVIEACAATHRTPNFRRCPWCGEVGHGLTGACLGTRMRFEP